MITILRKKIAYKNVFVLGYFLIKGLINEIFWVESFLPLNWVAQIIPSRFWMNRIGAFDKPYHIWIIIFHFEIYIIQIDFSIRKMNIYTIWIVYQVARIFIFIYYFVYCLSAAERISSNASQRNSVSGP